MNVNMHGVLLSQLSTSLPHKRKLKLRVSDRTEVTMLFGNAPKNTYVKRILGMPDTVANLVS